MYNKFKYLNAEVEKVKKNTRKYVLFMFLLMVMLCITGCGNHTDTNGTESENNKDSDSTTNGDTDITDCIGIDTGTYNSETDAQSFYLWGDMAKTKNGFYFFDSTMLMFFDLASKQLVPVCNKPNCEHDSIASEGCNAIFSEYNITYDHMSGVRYYDGYLYITGCDEEGYDCLYRIAQDGSTREKYMKLYRSGRMSTETESYRRAPSFWIHRGYVYYINEMEETQVIRRMELGKDKAEVVYEAQGERATIYRMKAYGDYLVFQTGNFAEDMINIEARICAYNIKTGEIGTIVNDVYNEYHIYDGKVYYTTATEIRCYDMDSKEDEAIIEGNNGYYEFCLDDTYIYTFEDGGTLRVYNHGGAIKCTVADKKVRNLYYVHDGYLLSDISASGAAILGLIEVSDFADGKAQWDIFKY